MIQPRLRHPVHENGRRVAFPLNVTYGSYPEVAERKFETSIPRAEVNGGGPSVSPGICSHISHSPRQF